MVDADGDTWYQAPGNGDVVGYVKPDGTQCTVGGCVTPEQQEKMDEEETDGSTAKYDPNNPYMNLPNQEWRENAPITSGELQTRNEILNGTYEGEDAEQILEAINYYEEKYSK